MGSFFTCKSCGTNAYLHEQKDELTFPQGLICHNCGQTNSYYAYEVQQERYDFSCGFCNNRFYIRKTPPIDVTCPHCHSLLQITSDGAILIIRNGTLPESRTNDSLLGALGGLVLGGALAGGAGALAGAIIGASLGSRGTLEAIY